MNIDDLKSGYYIFGNKGAVWEKQCHIFKVGMESTTLCGTPMLSTNWAQIEGVPEIGCLKCIKIYETQTTYDPLIKIIKVINGPDVSQLEFDNGAIIDFEGYQLMIPIGGCTPLSMEVDALSLMTLAKIMRFLDLEIIETEGVGQENLEYYLSLDKEEFEKLLTLKE